MEPIPWSDRSFGGQRVVGSRAFRRHFSEGAESSCHRALSDGVVMFGWDVEGGQVELELSLVQGAEVANSEREESDVERGIVGADGVQEGLILDRFPLEGNGEWGIPVVGTAGELEEED